MPVIVTALFESQDFEKCLRMIWSVKEYGGNYHLAIFDMTDPRSERKVKSEQYEYRNLQSVSTVCTVQVRCAIYVHRVMLVRCVSTVCDM